MDTWRLLTTGSPSERAARAPSQLSAELWVWTSATPRARIRRRSRRSARTSPAPRMGTGSAGGGGGRGGGGGAGLGGGRGVGGLGEEPAPGLARDQRVPAVRAEPARLGEDPQLLAAQARRGFGVEDEGHGDRLPPLVGGEEEASRRCATSDRDASRRDHRRRRSRRDRRPRAARRRRRRASSPSRPGSSGRPDSSRSGG